jgi:uncharacterized protein (DUF342 family)
LVPGLQLDAFHDNLLTEIVKDLLSGHNITRRRIAKGTEPIPGREGRLVILVKPYPQKGAVRETVDPWFVRGFDNIEEGTIVGRVYEPKPGKDGVDAFGARLASQVGKAVEIKTDGSLLIGAVEDGGFRPLIARVAGYLLIEGSSLKLVDRLVIKGDVDIDSGDIDFIGSVQVDGLVGKNFRIRARKDIEIKGDVLDALLGSKFGNIKVMGHSQGHLGEEIALGKTASFSQLSRAWVDEGFNFSAGGDVDLIVASNLSIEAKGEIRIAKEGRLSNLRSQTAIRMPKGNLYGGIATAVCGLEVNIVGNAQGLRTFIELKSDVESTGDYVILTNRINKFKGAIETLRLTLGPYADNPSRLVLLKPEHKKKMEELRKQMNMCERELTKMEKERADLLKRSRRTLIHRVNILGRAYPGVQITVDEIVYPIDSELKGPVTIEYSRETNQFSVGELKPLVCEF